MSFCWDTVSRCATFSIIPLDHGRCCLSRVRALSALCRAAVCRGGKSRLCSVGYGRRLGSTDTLTTYKETKGTDILDKYILIA